MTKPKKQIQVQRSEKISAMELEKLTGFSDSWHRKLAKRGYFHPPVNGVYELQKTLAGLFRYFKSREETVSGELASVRLQRERDKARIGTVEADRAEGSVIPLVDAKRAFARAGAVTKSKLLAIPSAIAPLLANKPPVEIEEKLRPAILEALAEIENHDWRKSK